MYNVKSSAWDSDDRKKLQEWIGENHYRAAFLLHTVPLKPLTLERIKNGCHDPKGLLRQRLRDVISQHPGGSLPHDMGLLSA